MGRLAIALGMACLLGFSWPGQGARVVGDLTSARTPRDKRDALRLLARLREPFAVEAVLPFARDPDSGVRADALRLLSEVGVRAEVEDGLDDPAPEVRIAATEALGSVRALDDPEPAVRLAALPYATLRPLISRLDDDALEVRIAAAHALASRPEREARDALLVHADAALPELRAAVIDALGVRSPDAEVTRALVRAQGDRDLEVVRAASRAKARQAPAPSEPAWLAPLMRTASAPADGDALFELELTLDVGAQLATEPLREWLTRAPRSFRDRILALIARSEDTARTIAPH